MKTEKEPYGAKTRYLDDSVAARYDNVRFSGWIGRLKHRTTQSAIAKALDATGLTREHGLVMDLPCGTGRMISLLEKRGLSWIAVDVSPAMVGQARLKGGEPQDSRNYLCTDAESIALASDSVDGLIAIRFIHHIPVDIRGRVLGELRRVTRKHAVIEYRRTNAFRAFLRKITGASAVRNVMTDESIARELATAGFEIIHRVPVSRLFSNSVMFVCRKAASAEESARQG